MAKLTYGTLSEAWKGEASDFTPLLAAQLDALGAEIGVELTTVGETEVSTTGGRRIDIVAPIEGGREFVIENQYGTADHDHLTRGLAYAVARRARGLIVVAESHRDEFKAVAQYLNEVAEHDPERGIAVWLVEARAVRIEDSAWAPLFSTVVETNDFTASVDAMPQQTTLKSVDEFLAQFDTDDGRGAARDVVESWKSVGHKLRLGPNHVVLEAKGPSVGGVRTVVAIYSDGAVMVPFTSYAGTNTGIPIESLTTAEFRASADALFGFNGSEKVGRTSAGWLRSALADELVKFCRRVADAYAAVLRDGSGVGATEETA